ncbi:MAG: sulfatase-like hydrolase/transferase [Phycisphaerae bacterium]|nr:sulfatase-like hydrolase/transferase [Phycisphaerae bacterium]
MNRAKRTRREFLKAAGLCVSALTVAGCEESGPLPALPPAEQPQPTRPNILWITCEDTSPYLGCYGDPFAVTPNLDRLASQSIRYTNAYATAPVCSPSRSCLITGVYATSLGTQNLRSDVRIPRQIEPLPKRLRVAGYYCSNNFKEDYNFKDPMIWDDSSTTAHWRHRVGGVPFFSVFNIMCTHQSQVNGSDEEFFQKYSSKLKGNECHDPQTLSLPPFYPDTPVVREMWARYYDLITTMDKQVGELLQQLEADGLAQNTIVFFFADHGLGLPRFKRTLYDTGLRVPLIVRIPPRYQHLAPLAAGGQTDRLISFVDFAPTVLNLAGVPVPPYMQGQPFLGQTPAPPREYIFATHSRVDEAYDMSRCVRDKRYKYIRNFMPHLPYVQPSDYCDQAEIMQELRRVAKEGGLAGLEKLFWEPTKPLEELYDTLTDPIEVKNLAGAPEHEPTLNHMRKRLWDWMAETKDVELLPEAEMHLRAAGSTPYEIARDPRKYPQSRILAAAELVGTGPRVLPALVDFLKDQDSAVRYWAAVGIEALGPEAAPAADALKAALDDPSPNVRFTAAGTLCRLGSNDQALLVLAQGLLEPREVVVLYAARTLQGLGDKARPIVLQMATARERCRNLDGSYKNDNYAMFIDWALKHAMESCKE